MSSDSLIDVRKAVTRFVNEELGISPSKDSKYKRKTGITVIKSEALSSVVSRGIAITRIMTSLSSDLEKINRMIKKVGGDTIRGMNGKGEDIKSIRFSSTNEDLSVLVTLTNRGKPDGRAANALKKKIGEERFKKIFSENTTWKIKEEFVDQCIRTLAGTFGSKFIKDALTSQTSYSVKSKEELRLLYQEEDDEMLEKLNKFIKPSEPSITYPK